MLLKNVAGQGIYFFAYDKTTGIGLAGDQANITGRMAKDGPTETVLGAATNIAAGSYWQPLTQTETNCNVFNVRWSSVTPNIIIDSLIGTTDRNAKLHQLFGSTASDVTDNSFAAQIVSKTGVFGTFSPSTDSLEGISDSVGSLSPISTAAISATVVSGSIVSGTYVNTITDDDIRFTLAPVAGTGLNVQLNFNLGNNRVPTSVAINGYFNGSSSGVHVEVYNIITSGWDRLSNATTWMGTRNAEIGYVYSLARENVAVDGSVIIRFIATSTNTGHRLYLDRVALYHITEEGGSGGIITPQQIWEFAGGRTLTGSIPGTEPVIPASKEEITEYMWGYSQRTLTQVFHKGVEILGFNDLSTVQVGNIIDGAFLTVGITANVMANLDSPISQIWAVSERTLTSGANIVLVKDIGLIGLSEGGSGGGSYDPQEFWNLSRTGTFNTDSFAEALTVIRNLISGNRFSATALSLAPTGSGGGSNNQGSGAIEYPYYVKDLHNCPLPNVDVWITSDKAGEHVIAGTLLTDTSGCITFLLDAGYYWAWCQLSGYNFNNPEWIVVEELILQS